MLTLGVIELRRQVARLTLHRLRGETLCKRNERMASTTFSGPVTSQNGFIGAFTGNITGNVTGNVTGSVTGAIKVPTYTVAGAPSAATAGAGTILYISNGAAGSPVLAFSNGTNWLRVDTLATISAS